MTLKEKVEEAVSSELRLADFIKSKNITVNSKGFMVCPSGHDSKAPSLSVDLTNDRWHCFGCNRHGMYISFYALYLNISYDKAIRLLAKELGIKGESVTIKPPRAKVHLSIDKNYLSYSNTILQLKRKKDINDIIEFLARVQEGKEFNAGKKIETEEMFSMTFEDE